MKLLLAGLMLLTFVACGITNEEKLDKPEFEVIKVETDCSYDAYFLSLDKDYDTEIQILHDGLWVKALSTDRDIAVVYKSEFNMNFRIRYVAYGMKSDWAYYKDEL